MNKERLYLENMPQDSKLKELLKKNYGETFPKIYHTQIVPLIQMHFEANTSKEMVEIWLIDELKILLGYMVGEKTAEEVKAISHKLSNILVEVQ